MDDESGGRVKLHGNKLNRSLGLKTFVVVFIDF